MLARSPVKRGARTKKKIENETVAVDDFPAPKQDQGHVVAVSRGKKTFPSRPRGDKPDDGEVEVCEYGKESKRITPSPVSGSATAVGTGKAIHKLDDEAFKPFGPRSRSSSEAGSGCEASCKGGPQKVCGELVKSTEAGVQCDKCDNWYHISCQDVPKPAYEALQKYDVLSWFCSDCHVVSKVNDSELLTALENKIEKLDTEVKVQLSRMVTCLREQERAVDHQTKMIERSLKESVSQRSTYAEMVKGSCSEVVSKVSAKLSSFPQLVSERAASKDVQNMSRVVDDFMDRDRRKSNIVVHNLAEVHAETLADRSNQDIIHFQQLAKDAFRLNIRVSKCFRVGKAIEGRPRLLILTLESPDMKQDVLQLAPQLRNTEQWGNIYITPDLSKAEREIAKRLRDELRARKAAGEVNLIIRKGKIVSSSRQSTPAVDAMPGRAEGITQVTEPASINPVGGTMGTAEYPNSEEVTNRATPSTQVSGLPTQNQA